MQTVLIILGIIVVLCLMSVGGWILRILGVFASFFFEGIDNCFGCLLKLVVWIIAIIIIGMMIAEQI